MQVSEDKQIKNKGNNEIKERLKGYGILLGYSLVGMFGLGFFAFKMIMIRQQNLANIKKKSTLPLMHSNMRNFTIGGAVSLVAYTCGLSYLMDQVPKSETNIQLRDNAQLPLQDQTSPTLQEHYIFKTMRMFRVNEKLIQKANQQFIQMSKNQPENIKLGNERGQNQSVNSAVFKSMWEKFKMEIKNK